MCTNHFRYSQVSAGSRSFIGRRVGKLRLQFGRGSQPHQAARRLDSCRLFGLCSCPECRLWSDVCLEEFPVSNTYVGGDYKCSLWDSALVNVYVSWFRNGFLNRFILGLYVWVEGPVLTSAIRLRVMPGIDKQALTSRYLYDW